jgi:hypothetical protein
MEGVRVTIRWTGLLPFGMERHIEELLAGHSFECTDRGRDTAGDKERVLVFRSAGSAVVSYQCPECNSTCSVVWLGCPAQEEVECGECGARAKRA